MPTDTSKKGLAALIVESLLDKVGYQMGFSEGVYQLLGMFAEDMFSYHEACEGT